MKVVQGPVDPGKNDLAGCIMASSTSTCDGERQSGKRLKQHFTGLGPTDLVFDTDPDGTLTPITDDEGNTLDGDIGYRVFHKVTNETGVPLTGFNTVFGEDMIATDGFCGSYGDTFGSWLTGDAVPTRVFFDDGDDAVEDPLIAWMLEDESYEQRRTFDDDGNIVNLDEFALFADFDALDAALAGFGLLTGVIEDLANLNVNFAINTTGYSGDSFTLRATPSPVPLPATAPLLVAGIGAFAMIRRRNRARTA